MKAVACSDAKLAVVELDQPRPGKGQLLVDVARCGICGSDLHARHHCDELADVMVEVGYDAFMRSSQSVVFGHEFSGTVVERGPGARDKGLAEGTPVVSLPVLRHGSEVHATGLSTHAPGGYAEQVLVQEAFTVAVPNGLALDVAATTEPMAVGWHAVQRSEIKKGDAAVVVGCGPVGLAVILMLKAKGVQTVVASDLTPGRRALATRCGADIVVDPAVESPYEAARTKDHMTSVPDMLELGLSTVEQMKRLPVGWWHTWRAVDAVGLADLKRPIVFECVGVPGMIDRIMAEVPLASRVIVVGVCMGDDQIRPSMGINKEIELRFVLGYTPLEFRDTLHMIADGKVDPRPLLTAEVGLEGVAAAFDALGDPEAHAKILIDPKSDATAPVA